MLSEWICLIWLQNINTKECNLGICLFWKLIFDFRGVVSEGKNISDILQEMQDDEEYGVEEVINQLAPVKEITASVCFLSDKFSHFQ